MTLSSLSALTPTALADSWKGAARRFPVPVSLAALLSLLVMGAIHQAWGPEDLVLTRLLAGGGVGLLLSLAASLLCEARGWPFRTGVWSGMATTVLTVLAFLGLSEEQVLWRLAFLGPAAFLLAVTAVLIGRPGELPVRAWYRAVGDLGACAFGGLVALIIGGGVSLGFVALDLLLGVDVSGEVYGDVWAVSVLGIWTVTALARLRPMPLPTPTPATGAEDAEGVMPGWLAILVAGPLTILAVGYLLIILLYLGRIALSGGLPDNEVGWVLCLYLAFGAVTLLLSYPLRREGPALSRLFARTFPLSLPLPLGVLVVALAQRIDAYGVTESRYVVGLLAVWLASLAVIYGGATLLRRDTRPVWIPLILGGLLAAASMGPWGALGLSIRSQVAETEQVLADLGIRTVADVPDRPEDNPDAEDALHRLDRLLDYLEERDALDRLAPLLEDPPEAIKDQVYKKYYRAWEQKSGSVRGPDGVLAVTGYDLAIPVTFWQSSDPLEPGADLTVTMDWERLRLRVDRTDGAWAEIDLVSYGPRAKAEGWLKADAGPVDAAAAALDSTAGEGLRARLLIKEAGVEWGETKPPRVVRVEGWVLVGE